MESYNQFESAFLTEIRPLTYFRHVQAVLLGGVVSVGGYGGHGQTVHHPYRCVAAVKVAAVGAASHIVWTFQFGFLPSQNQRKNTFR